MFTINARIRQNEGKSANRRLRLSNKIPAIIYGKKISTISIEIEQSKIWSMQNKPEFYNSVLTIIIEDKKIKTKVKAVQRHLFKQKLTHIDFIRI